MIDLTNIRQVDLIIYDPNGKKTIVTKYVNIDTNAEVSATLINGQKVETIVLSCSNICVA